MLFAPQELLKATLGNNPWDLVVDTAGRIVQISPRYARLLGVDAQRAVDAPVEQVIHNTKMHRVLASGLPETADIWETNGKQIVISRFPVLWHGSVIGAVAILTFSSPQEARVFAKQLARIWPEPGRSEAVGAAPAPPGATDVVAQAPAMQRAMRLARLAARGNSTVLLIGETGTGKEVFAQAIHRASSRCSAPLVKVNCAALPRDLLESELFGYEDGAFTGARRGGKPGRFELASGGTLFLDEIGEMPPELQPKLLRVLQDMEIDRLGSTRSTRVDVRLVAATNANLEQMVKAGKFRADLYYRLSVVTVQLPPLRERLEDLPALVDTILARLNRQMGRNVEGLTTDALDLLKHHNWPGNVRELQNILERALNVVSDGRITGEHLLTLSPHLASLVPSGAAPISVQEPPAPEGDDLDLRNWLQDAEVVAIRRALTIAAGNKTRAADLLGIHRSVLHEKIKKYKLA